MPPDLFSIGEYTLRVTLFVDNKNDSSAFTSATSSGRNQRFSVSASSVLFFSTAHICFSESVDE